MPRKRIASARITAKLGSDDFSTASFTFWVSDAPWPFFGLMDKSAVLA
jgi:hypothetical protein